MVRTDPPESGIREGEASPPATDPQSPSSSDRQERQDESSRTSHPLLKWLKDPMGTPSRMEELTGMAIGVTAPDRANAITGSWIKQVVFVASITVGQRPTLGIAGVLVSIALITWMTVWSLMPSTVADSGPFTEAVAATTWSVAALLGAALAVIVERTRSDTSKSSYLWILPVLSLLSLLTAGMSSLVALLGSESWHTQPSFILLTLTFGTISGVIGVWTFGFFRAHRWVVRREVLDLVQSEERSVFDRALRTIDATLDDARHQQDSRLLDELYVVLPEFFAAIAAGELGPDVQTARGHETGGFSTEDQSEFKAAIGLLDVSEEDSTALEYDAARAGAAWATTLLAIIGKRPEGSLKTLLPMNTRHAFRAWTHFLAGLGNVEELAEVAVRGIRDYAASTIRLREHLGGKNPILSLFAVQQLIWLAEQTDVGSRPWSEAIRCACLAALGEDPYHDKVRDDEDSASDTSVLQPAGLEQVATEINEVLHSQPIAPTASWTFIAAARDLSWTVEDPSLRIKLLCSCLTAARAAGRHRLSLSISRDLLDIADAGSLSLTSKISLRNKLAHAIDSDGWNNGGSASVNRYATDIIIASLQLSTRQRADGARDRYRAVVDRVPWDLFLTDHEVFESVSRAVELHIVGDDDAPDVYENALVTSTGCAMIVLDAATRSVNPDDGEAAHNRLGEGELTILFNPDVDKRVWGVFHDPDLLLPIVRRQAETPQVETDADLHVVWLLLAKSADSPGEVDDAVRSFVQWQDGRDHLSPRIASELARVISRNVSAEFMSAAMPVLETIVASAAAELDLSGYLFRAVHRLEGAASARDLSALRTEVAPFTGVALLSGHMLIDFEMAFKFVSEVDDPEIASALLPAIRALGETAATANARYSYAFNDAVLSTIADEPISDHLIKAAADAGQAPHWFQGAIGKARRQLRHQPAAPEFKRWTKTALYGQESSSTTPFGTAKHIKKSVHMADADAVATHSEELAAAVAAAGGPRGNLKKILGFTAEVVDPEIASTLLPAIRALAESATTTSARYSYTLHEAILSTIAGESISDHLIEAATASGQPPTRVWFDVTEATYRLRDHPAYDAFRASIDRFPLTTPPARNLAKRLEQSIQSGSIPAAQASADALSSKAAMSEPMPANFEMAFGFIADIEDPDIATALLPAIRALGETAPTTNARYSYALNEAILSTIAGEPIDRHLIERAAHADQAPHWFRGAVDKARRRLCHQPTAESFSEWADTATPSPTVRFDMLKRIEESVRAGDAGAVATDSRQLAMAIRSAGGPTKNFERLLGFVADVEDPDIAAALLPAIRALGETAPTTNARYSYALHEAILSTIAGEPIDRRLIETATDSGDPPPWFEKAVFAARHNLCIEGSAPAFIPWADAAVPTPVLPSSFTDLIERGVRMRDPAAVAAHSRGLLSSIASTGEPPERFEMAFGFVADIEDPDIAAALLPAIRALGEAAPTTNARYSYALNEAILSTIAGESIDCRLIGAATGSGRCPSWFKGAVNAAERRLRHQPTTESFSEWVDTATRGRTAPPNIEHPDRGRGTSGFSST